MITIPFVQRVPSCLISKMNMKRPRAGEEAQSTTDINMANVLMLFSRGGAGGGEEIDVISVRPASPARVFECKTCSRQFPSFQALGGHRASHKKPRLPGVDGALGARTQVELPKPRVHECSVCGLEFAVGQALGGHMRRHRIVPSGGGSFEAHGLAEKKVAGCDGEKLKRALWLDLNAAPEEEVVGYRKTIFGFELVDKTPMVDWSH